MEMTPNHAVNRTCMQRRFAVLVASRLPPFVGPLLMDRAEIIANACALIQVQKLDVARKLIFDHYPPVGPSTSRGAWSVQSLLRIFVRDGFTDRYFGVRLIFPGALRMLSLLMPEEFPYHPNWKQSKTHPAFWEHYPTIDHVIPLPRGGRDDETNLVTHLCSETVPRRIGSWKNWAGSQNGLRSPRI